jgi:hypothetical protein
VLRPLRDAGLRAQVVWVPKVGGQARHVPEATRLVPSAGALHYWDQTGTLMERYAEVLGFGEDAWDVYLLYGPGARWEGELPPAPDFWMHQLGTPERPRVEGPYLEAGKLRARVAELLGEPGGR